MCFKEVTSGGEQGQKTGFGNLSAIDQLTANRNIPRVDCLVLSILFNPVLVDYLIQRCVA
jgi:hypothetical protein